MPVPCAYRKLRLVPQKHFVTITWLARCRLCRHIPSEDLRRLFQRWLRHCVRRRFCFAFGMTFLHQLDFRETHLFALWSGSRPIRS